MQTIHQNKSGIATYDAEKKRVYFTFEGIVNIELSKELYYAVLDFMKQNKVDTFINDLRHLKGTFTGFNEWAITELRPMVDLGLKYDALILSSDIFTAFAANDLAGKVHFIELQIFKDMATAEEWADSKL